MAKKPSFSYLEVQGKLEAISSTTTKETLVFDLLSIFCGYGEGAIRRIIEGHGNESKEERTIVIKKLLAYRYSEINLYGEEDLYAILDDLRNSPSITRKQPRLYIASDGHKIVAYDPIENDIYENEISLLWRDFEFFKPLAGIEKIHNTEEAEADVRSAEMVARIYDEIRRHNDIRDAEQAHNINIFMTRLLFCYFAEDTGIFPEENMFTTAIKQDTKSDASDFEEFIGGIFDIMAIDSQVIRASLPEKITKFPYVNGGLFSEHCPIPVLSSKARALMIKCGESDWREINPDIFGSMIQAVVQPEERSNLGIHYTSVPNILKVIRPLFLDELFSEFVKLQNDLKGLDALRIRLSKIKFFDPACGSGNFLVITYKTIRDLEIQIWKRIQEISGEAILPFSDISLTQFYGIEVSDYACDTAKLSLWLAEHQMNVLFGEVLNVTVNPLPLHPSGNIVCNNACRIDWDTVCPHSSTDEVYIMGNPPYRGSKLLNSEQRQDMLIALSQLKGKKVLDYIAAWFWKGAQYIRGTKARFAFVSTNSISQGEQVSLLWNDIFQQDVSIFFARTSFKWGNNAKHNAAVICVIIGCAYDYKGDCKLYDEEHRVRRTVDHISPYLDDSNNVIVFKSNNPPEGYPRMCFGCMPYDKGNLIMNRNEYEDFCEHYPKDVDLVKKLIGSYEFLNGECRYCFWIDDSESERAKNNPEIARRIAMTREFRLKSPDKGGRELAEKPYQFREYFVRDNSAIIVPRVSSIRRHYVPMGYVREDSVISDSAFAIYSASPWLFAILSSKLHTIWATAFGGKLKTDYRYSATLCYNTFPFPKISATQKNELNHLAERLLLSREAHSEMTIAEMYNPESMPSDVLRAHLELDGFVDQLYRKEPFSSDAERLSFLLKEYSKRNKVKDNTLWKTL